MRLIVRKAAYIYVRLVSGMRVYNKYTGEIQREPKIARKSISQ